MTRYRNATTGLAIGIFAAFGSGYTAAANADPTARAVFVFLLGLYCLLIGWLAHAASTKP